MLDILLATKKVWRQFDFPYFHLGILVIYIISIRLFKQTRKTTLFVWFASMPTTIFIYLIWCYKCNLARLNLYELIVYGLALAQLGWVAGLLSITGATFNSKTLRLTAFAVSAASFGAHTLYIFLTAISSNSA